MKNSRPRPASRIFSFLLASLLLCQSAFANLPYCNGTCSSCPCTGNAAGGRTKSGSGAGNGEVLPADADGAGVLRSYGSPDVTPFRSAGGFASPDVMGGFLFGSPWMPPMPAVVPPATGGAHVGNLSLAVNYCYIVISMPKRKIYIWSFLRVKHYSTDAFHYMKSNINVKEGEMESLVFEGGNTLYIKEDYLQYNGVKYNIGEYLNYFVEKKYIEPGRFIALCI